MKPFLSILRVLMWIIVFVALNGLSLFGYSSSYLSRNNLILARLLFGFIPFLQINLPAISWNAATWGPGLGAFLIAVVFLHRWLGRWASRKGRPWSFATSFCLVSLVPVLFVISFLVPGVLLQWETLRETVWLDVR